MDIAKAQHDVRTTFLGGFAGQLVSGMIWLASAAASAYGSLRTGAVLLVLVGFFIFPLTQLTLRLMGHAFALPKGHPMNALGIQVAFTLPLTLPVVFAAALHRHAWFYPAFMIVLGAHYLPFVFSYGMRMFAVLSALLVGGGVALLYIPAPVTLGAWCTGALLLVFAAVGRHLVLAEQRQTAATPVAKPQPEP